MKFLTPEYVLSIMAVLVLPMSILAPKGLAPLFVVTVVLLLIGQKQNGILKISPNVVNVSFASLIILAPLSALWSVTPGDTLKTTISLAATVLGGIYLVHASVDLSQKESQLFQKIVLIGGGIGFALLMFEQSQNAIITQIVQEIAGKKINPNVDNTLVLNSASSVAVILFWPWAFTVYIRFTKFAAIATIAIVASSLFFSGSSSPIFAFVSGAVIFIVYKVMPKVFLPVFSVVIFAGILAAPMIVDLFPNPLSVKQDNYAFRMSPSAFSNSISHRFAIWHTTVVHIKERPILGHGFDTSRKLYNSESKRKFRFFADQPERTWVGYFEPIPLHPHNGILQIWLEFGLLGALTLAVFMFGLLSIVSKNINDELGKATIIGLIVTTMFLYSASFGAWQSWWLSGLFLLAAITISVVNNATTRVRNDVNRIH